MNGLLPALARRGRWVLVAGLAAGVALPGLAVAMAGLIVPLIVFLLFLALLRLGPRASLPARAELPRALAAILSMQLLLPLAAAAALANLGIADRPAATGVVLVLAAAPITGAPGLALLAGADARVALRQVALGTALLPITAFPVFLLLPVFPDLPQVAAAALRLLALIAAAAAAAALMRRIFPVVATAEGARQLDGLIALVMGLVVIGLMSAVGPALLAIEPRLFGTLVLVFALQLALALAAWSAWRARRPAFEAAGYAVSAGNRNLALFLAALPPETVTELLLFVGCYQVPMYLAPLVFPRIPGWPRAGQGQS